MKPELCTRPEMWKIIIVTGSDNTIKYIKINKVILINVTIIIITNHLAYKMNSSVE